MIQARGVKLSLRVFSRLASIVKITDKRTSLVHLRANSFNRKSLWHWACGCNGKVVDELEAVEIIQRKD